MNGLLFEPSSDVYGMWSAAVGRLLWSQWTMLDAQYAAGIDLLDAVAGRHAGAASSIETLECYALQRVREGLAPPREIYEANNRKRIDWFLFPEWAKPIDPEVFDDCGHEG